MPRLCPTALLAASLAACAATPAPDDVGRDAPLTDAGNPVDRPDVGARLDAPRDVPADLPRDVPVLVDSGPPGCFTVRGADLLPSPGRELGPHSAQSLVVDPSVGGIVLAPATRPGAFVADQPITRGAIDADGFYMNGWWYLLGGQTDSTHTSTELLAAPLETDGTLGPWSARTPYAIPILDHIILAYAGRAYLTGGARDRGNDNVIQLTEARWAVPLGGDVTPWNVAPDNPVRRFGHEALIAAGYLYTLGGDDGDMATDDVSFAPILPDGSLGAWRRTTPLPGGVNQFLAGAATSQHVWAFGGCRHKDCETVANIEQRAFVADIQTDGSLSAWRLAGNLPVPNYDHKIVVAGGRIVMTGGRAGGRSRCGDSGGDNYDGVWWSELRVDGTLSPWEYGTAVNVALPRVRSDHFMRVDHLGQLWIIGGRTSCIGAETVDFNDNYPREVWRSSPVALGGRARVGSWLSGPLTPATAHPTSLRWDGDDGITVQVRFARTADPNAWTSWTAPTTGRTVALGADVARAQVLATFAGDGTHSPVLRAVSLDCAP